MGLGVYITLKNDEHYIADVIRPVQIVFPQVRVLDLGSTDRSIKRIQSTGVEYECHNVNGPEFTALKNEYSKKHDWVFWIDSDEIYPVESLKKMNDLIRVRASGDGLQTIRCSWKLIKHARHGAYKISKGLKLNGHKAHNTKLYTYTRAWPREVLSGPERHKESTRSEFNGIWCWHAVLLERSSRDTSTARRKKREYKLAEYSDLKWEKVSKLPWRT